MLPILFAVIIALLGIACYRILSRAHAIVRSAAASGGWRAFASRRDLPRPPGNIVIQHVAFPLPSPVRADTDYDPRHPIPCRKVMGGFSERRKAFRPASVVNLSGTGGDTAVNALIRGAVGAGCLLSAGDRALPPHHPDSGLIFQVGASDTACRDGRGQHSIARLIDVVDRHPSIRAIAIAFSPWSRHTAFHDPDSLLDVVETVAAATGLPVGIETTAGQIDFWRELARLIDTTSRTVDFVTIDDGTDVPVGAPPLFAARVGLPFRIGFSRVHRVFMERDLHDRVVFIGAGAAGRPDLSLVAFALGCDMINVGREGVKARRIADALIAHRADLLALSRAAGVLHPALIDPRHIDIVDQHFGARSVADLFGGRDQGLTTDDEQPFARRRAGARGPLAFRRR